MYLESQIKKIIDSSLEKHLFTSSSVYMYLWPFWGDHSYAILHNLFCLPSTLGQTFVTVMISLTTVAMVTIIASWQRHIILIYAAMAVHTLSMPSYYIIIMPCVALVITRILLGLQEYYMSPKHVMGMLLLYYRPILAYIMCILILCSAQQNP